MKLLDTSFLIHLQREWARGESGPARRYLQREESEEFSISVITALEFLEGYRQLGDGERFLEPFSEIEISEGVARVASRIRRTLRQQGEPIGDFDVLIAATALTTGLPVVTDNTRHFERVDGLVVETVPVGGEFYATFDIRKDVAVLRKELKLPNDSGSLAGVARYEEDRLRLEATRHRTG